jgi:hypothetical protein
MEFKPDGSPVSRTEWLRELCWSIRRQPNMDRQLTLSFYRYEPKEKPQMVLCLMELKECTVTNLSVIKEIDYEKSM